MTVLDPPARKLSALIPLFTATIFLSAALLFFVQPLFARIVLPEIGGAPAVWTTAMLFFQSVLLGGYVYAHLSTKYLPMRAQLGLHLIIWVVALFFLPLGIPEGWTLDLSAPVAGQTLLLFAAGVGVPFALLSANAPLIQSWYAATDGPSADDPYFLYGASNLGSFVALLAFPLLAEPFFGASSIGFAFAAGFVLLGAGLLTTGLSAKAKPRSETTKAQSKAIHETSFLFWAALAFVPSSLMLAVTTKISTDIGALPVIWVLPLALFLLTFTLTFTRTPILPERILKLAAIAGAALSFAVFIGLFGNHLSLLTALLLVVAFFVVALWCHARLYALRPGAAHLTTFYITMSVGGALGGLFNAILAPSLFPDLFEGPVTLIALAILFIASAGGQHRQIALRGALVSVVGISAIVALTPSDQIFRDRSFFGTHKVIEQNGLRLYTNGTTVHGAERIVGTTGRPEPLAYYHRNGPMGQTLANASADARIGIVGQGVGSLACYAKPGQDWTFYEIDPMVDHVARNSGHFAFMETCAGDAPTLLGDARIVLQGQTDVLFDILVIDAFSSTAVPVHLMTTEAVRLYMDRLAPGGVVLFHISNRYYDLPRPLGRIAAAEGIVAVLRNDPGDLANDPGHSGSRVAALARSRADLEAAGIKEDWAPLASDGGTVWTDDFANPLSILNAVLAKR